MSYAKIGSRWEVTDTWSLFMSTRGVCALSAQRWTAFILSLPWRHVVQGVPLHYTLLEYLSLCDVCALRCGVECGSSRRSTRCREKKRGPGIGARDVMSSILSDLKCRWLGDGRIRSNLITTYMTKKNRNYLFSLSSSLSPSPPFANLITTPSEVSGLRAGPSCWNYDYWSLDYLALFQFRVFRCQFI
jgi:hypothetical protein